MESSLKVQLDNGQIYSVPESVLWQDMRDTYLAGGFITEDNADQSMAERQKEDPDGWKVWFNDHFDWQDVVNRGTLIRDLDNEEIQQMISDQLHQNGSSLTLIEEH